MNIFIGVNIIASLGLGQPASIKFPLEMKGKSQTLGSGCTVFPFPGTQEQQDLTSC